MMHCACCKKRLWSVMFNGPWLCMDCWHNWNDVATFQQYNCPGQTLFDENMQRVNVK